MPIPIYPAGPLGFSEAGRYFYNGVFLPMLKESGFNPLDPWTLTEQSVINKALEAPYGPKKRDAWREANDIIGNNNVAAIRKAKLVVAILDGTDVDSGTASEIGFAAGIGVPSIGYRGDFRLSSDNIGSVVNLQVEKFIHMHGGEIVASMEDLRSLLARWHQKLQQAI